MSETDDTDDLLLIPPDFFVVQQEIQNPYYDLVDSLIEQVTNLQERIETIESTSDISLVNSCLDYSIEYLQRNMSRLSNLDDINPPQSTQSTPQKPHTKFKLNSLPASPNIDRYSPRKFNRSPRKSKDGSVSLEEIDTFLSKVKTIQRYNAARKLESEFNKESNKDITEENVNKIMDELDRQSQKIEDRLRGQEKEINEPKAVKKTTWQCGDNVANDIYKETNSNVPEKQPKNANYVPLTSQFNSFSMYSQNTSDSSSESTQMTALNRGKNSNLQSRNDLLHSPLHSNAINVLNTHKKLLETSASSNEARPRGINTITDNLGILSLADIWESNQDSAQNSSKLQQKLQEEKLRRQHCEQLIQELQNKNLELQQKMSVAVKVDQSKNHTILQFQEALEKASGKLEKINREKYEWEAEVNRIKKNFSFELDEANKKVAYYEKEASKALNLAHNNQEKLKLLEKRCADLQSDLNLIEKKFDDLQHDYHRECEKNKQLSDILSQKEIELNENKSVLNQARSEVAQSKKAVEICQTEFSLLKNETERLREDLREEKYSVSKLSDQKRLLAKEIESYKNKEACLREEVEKTKKQLESNKIELKNFYQGQVEILVQNKLKEFQAQLDQAEVNFRAEIKKREMSIAKTAAIHIHQISEKYSLEIKLLEEKHQEEIRLYKIQNLQLNEEIQNLHTKLEEHKQKLQKQLQKAMEVQWNEVIRAITANNSPTPTNDQVFKTIDQLNVLRSRSYHNLEEVMSQNQFDQLNFRNFKDGIHTSTRKNDEDEKNMKTPVSSRNQKYNESEVQKYVNMLLNRQPGKPLSEAQQSENIGGQANYQNDQESANKQNGDSKISQRDRKHGKPPWK